MFLFLAAATVKAQDKSENYFAGKWSVSVMGTPSGDTTSAVVFELKDGKLTGTISPSNTAEAIKFSKIIEKGDSLTAYFSSNGYDVYIFLEKKDHITRWGL